jgi:plastocyanin
VVIGVNNTVQWLNLDTVTHSIIFLTFDIQGQPALDPGKTFSVTFTDVGKVSYFDMYYPWMHGTVIVVKE